VKILFEKISHIETMDDYLKIHLENAKPVITLMSLKTMLAKLPENMFCRVHRSFIISLDKIDSMKDSKISLGSVQIPIGGRFRKDIINHLNADKVLKESLKE
jgi:DNA-binding LytR/AlgR family response regulator